MIELTADDEFAPFWDACRAGRLVVQTCPACDQPRWPPRPACARCGTAGVEWMAVPGEASLYSWVVVHRTGQAALRDALPFTVVVVESHAHPGVRFLGRLAAEDEGQPLEVGRPMQVTFVEDHLGTTRPHWRTT